MAGRLTAGVAEAMATLVRNPLRTSLAGLAMAVAVATTATVQTSLDGLAQSARAASARAFGSDSFALTRIATGTLSRRELALRLERNPAITKSDARFVERVADGRVVYAATTQRTADVGAGSREFENATVNGTQATLPDIRDIGLDRGRFFSPAEEVAGAQVVVLGAEVAAAVFPGIDPLGATVRVGLRGFRVIGVQALQGSAGGQSLDRYVWMPLGAFERTFGAAASLQIFAKHEDGLTTTQAEDHARTSMRARRHLAPGTDDTFDIITPEASRTFVARITEQVSAAGPPIAVIALIAAMVVVTNTTLVSVTQRTREIGVRRAMGARRSDIVVETLAEASLVALVGGAAGLAVAALAVQALAGPVGLPLSLDWRVGLASLAAAALSGMAAGWYPARRAAALDIVDAMRQE